MLAVPAFTATRIKTLELTGNKRVSRDTVLFYMKSREQGIYSERILREDFNALWKTGFFENITIESFDTETLDRKLVKVTLKENPLISSVTYNTSKKISENDIKDKLQEHSIILSTLSYYNPSKVKKAEHVIKEMLVEKGYSQGSVTIAAEPAKDGQVALGINVTRGPKTRIGAIRFPGLEKTKISPAFLRGGMKHNKPHSLLTLVGGKDVYSKDKIEEDLQAVRAKLHEKGYLEAKVGRPEITVFRKKTVFGKIQEMTRISIPVQPGPQYRMGGLSIEGNKIVKTDFLKQLVPLKKGKVFNAKKRDKARETIQEMYTNMGYIYSQVAPTENLDPVKKVADLVLRVHEGEVAYIGKLEFEGNTFTRDHVLRREWMLQEGSRFNMGWLKNCLTRMRQLGLVDIAKDPEFTPDPKDPRKMHVKVHVKEMNRQTLTFNFGVSGYDGLFGAIGYSTQNFMGMGETLSVHLQYGTKSKQYRLAFTEPYLFNLPVNLGFSVHKTAMNYPWFQQESTGFSFHTSGRLWRFIRGQLMYSYSDVNIGNLDPSYLSNPLSALYYRDTKISSLAPTLYYSTVDSPMFPSRGEKVLFSYRYSGGFLGGEVNMHKTRLQLQKFLPMGKRQTLGMQFVHQAVIPFGGSTIPYYEKIFLGGEYSVRGFDIYKVGPRNENGDFIGGNKAFQLNLEYIITLNQQLSFALFYDIGNAYDFGQPISLKNVYTSTGLELRVFVPMLNVPFRLIFAYNPRTLETDHSNFAFRFAVGTSFN
jgi:outer membrane protein insertion porin family